MNYLNYLNYEKIVLGSEILLYNSLLQETIPDGMMFLDDEIVDTKTFETIRKATNEERRMFYQIRLNKLKMKEMERC